MTRYLPGYLKHYTFTPNEDAVSMSINVGAASNAVIISNYSGTSPANATVMNGMVNWDETTVYPSVSRLCVRKTDTTLTWYASNSGGGQDWSYDDGVLTISNATGWVFGANVRYDVFYW